jgi:hypothetical protein
MRMTYLSPVVPPAGTLTDETFPLFLVIATIVGELSVTARSRMPTPGPHWRVAVENETVGAVVGVPVTERTVASNTSMLPSLPVVTPAPEVRRTGVSNVTLVAENASDPNEARAVSVSTATAQTRTSPAAQGIVPSLFGPPALAVCERFAAWLASSAVTVTTFQSSVDPFS